MKLAYEVVNVSVGAVVVVGVEVVAVPDVTVLGAVVVESIASSITAALLLTKNMYPILLDVMYAGVLRRG